MPMSLVMVHNNSAKIDNGVFKVDRKFHVGMQTYAENIRAQLLTINPELAPDEAIMDLIEVPLSQLSYRVATVKVDRARRPVSAEIPRIRDQISHSRLVYGGEGMRTAEIARSVGIPYILILEYDLQTQVTVAMLNATSAVRRAIRASRCTWNYFTTSVPDMRQAHSLQCNGYPIYDATRSYNPNSLLYLDSRMGQELVMPRSELA